MFVDQADITITAGAGGRGCVSMRKEKYIPQGGPDGGDGGDGGSVYLEAAEGVDTLLDLVGRHHWFAEPGEMGKGKKQAGKDGKDMTIRVPPGTLVYDKTSALLIADLKTAGTKVRVAKGGKGGKGNIHFVNSVRQAPDFAEPGQPGQVRELHLELRLIADVGLVGLPNAGKSTLLSRFTHARPKIADYPFTTLSPQLGIAELDAERRLVIADIPGLIEGASEGAGLGLDFLRHIERTRVLVHMIDIMPIDGSNPLDAYHQIRKELEAYSPKLAKKPEFVAANKMDLAGASEALADLRTALPGKQIFAISAVAGNGLRPLLEELWLQVEREPENAPLIDERPYVPPETAQKRTDEEMFVYEEGDQDTESWEPVDADGEELAVDETEGAPTPSRGANRRYKGRKNPEGEVVEPTAADSRFINAAGDAIPNPEPKNKKAKSKRTMIEPVQPKVRGKGGTRITAAERRKAHQERQKKKELERNPAPEPVAPPPEIDPELAAEIEAIKADDARKGKYYSRKKTDI
jgi:GTP-binding protein